MEDPNKGKVVAISQSIGSPSSSAESLSKPIVQFTDYLRDNGKNLSPNELLAMVRLLGVMRNIVFMPGLSVLLSKALVMSEKMIAEEEGAGNRAAFAVYKKWQNGVRLTEKKLIEQTKQMKEAVNVFVDASDNRRTKQLAGNLEKQIVDAYQSMNNKAEKIDCSCSSEHAVGEIMYRLGKHFAHPINTTHDSEVVNGSLQSYGIRLPNFAPMDPESKNNLAACIATLTDEMKEKSVTDEAVWLWPQEGLQLLGKETRKQFDDATRFAQLFQIGSEAQEALHSLDATLLKERAQRFIQFIQDANTVKEHYETLDLALFRLTRSRGGNKNPKVEHSRNRIRLFACIFKQFQPKEAVIVSGAATTASGNKPRRPTQGAKRNGAKKRGKGKQYGVKYKVVQEKPVQQSSQQKKENNKQRTSVAVASAVLSKSISPVILEKNILKKYKFDSRIFLSEANDFYHRHSWYVHPLLKQHGIKRAYTNRTRSEQQDAHYSLPGMILRDDIQEPCYCFFHMCEDPRGVCYHRGFDETTQEEMLTASASQIKSSMQEISNDGATVPPLTTSAILKDDNLKQVIYDQPFDRVLVVFKKPYNNNLIRS